MKNNKIFLHNWQGSCDDEYVDIPWPLIHQSVGSDPIHWLQKKDPTQVQMILEKTADGWQSLWAEFYNSGIRVEFALKFNK
jgi:hypothetical protein